MVAFATQVKRRRGTTAQNDAFTGAEGEIVVDTERHELRVHDGVTMGGFKIGGGSGRNIGDIFYTTRTDTALAGAVECNGGTYSTADYTGDGSIGELLEAGKLDYISLTAYATAISTKGWCDKIGWNGTGTTSFRVPTLTPHIVQKNNIPVVGNGMTLGLTNGTQLGGLQEESDNTIRVRMNAYGKPIGTSWQEGDMYDRTLGVTTDPTKSGIIADLSETANLRVMVQLATGATDQALETCTSVLADVSGLKDMSNVTSTGKEAVVGWGMPDYSAGISVSGAGFVASSDGVWYILAYNNSDYKSYVVVNGETTSCGFSGTSGYQDQSAITVYLSKGDVVSWSKNPYSIFSSKFYPLKGANL